jgi:8-oxo-dGTP diphosphatase
MRDSSAMPRVGVGAVIWRGREVLLVRRKKEPRAGEWSLPGGAQEEGETVVEALLREVREETGLTIAVLGLIDVVDAIFRNQEGAMSHHFTLIDFSARSIAGEAKADDDAAEVRWVDLEDLPRYRLWSETSRIIDKSARLHGPLAD